MVPRAESLTTYSSAGVYRITIYGVGIVGEMQSEQLEILNVLTELLILRISPERRLSLFLLHRLQWADFGGDASLQLNVLRAHATANAKHEVERAGLRGRG